MGMLAKKISCKKIPILSLITLTIPIIFLIAVFSPIMQTGRAYSAPANVSAYVPEPNISENSPQLARYYHQQLRWVNCLTQGEPNFKCSFLTVPIDYAHPEAGDEHIFVYNVDPAKKIYAHVIINPGGPGASGEVSMSYRKYWQQSPYGEHLAITSFDPRGVGFSKPTSTCETDAEKRS